METDDRLHVKMPPLEVDPALDVCPACQGTGVLVEVEDGASRARPCPCREKAVAARRLAGMGLPPRYRGCTLANFQLVGGLTDDSVGRAKRIAENFVANYPAVDGGLLFMGPCGVGKTHLAAGMVNELGAAKGAASRFCDFADLLAQIKQGYAGNAFDEYAHLQPLLRTEILLLDDLGSMKIRDWTLDILSYVVNQRYVSGRLILATTNFLDEPAGTEESLADRIGPRLRSRLQEMCKTVNIAGRDFRKEQRQTGILRNVV